MHQNCTQTALRSRKFQLASPFQTYNRNVLKPNNDIETARYRLMKKTTSAIPFSALLVATTLASVVHPEEALFSHSGPGIFKRTLLASRDVAPAKTCNAIAFDWVGGDKFQQPFIVSSPGECCKMCQEIEDCVVWLWRGCCDHCWIKNSIPADSQRVCEDTDCISGKISPGPADEEDEETDKPLKDNPTEVNCERSGKVAAIGASYLACKAVLKRCNNPQKKDVRKYKDLEGDRKIFQSEPDAEGEAISSKKCTRVSRNACAVQATASKWPGVIDPECMALLMEGPASPSKGCKDQKQAQELFEESAEATCQKS